LDTAGQSKAPVILLQIAVSEKCIDARKEFTGDRGTTLCARRVADGWWQEVSHRNIWYAASRH
jgi:hypothetical protein